MMKDVGKCKKTPLKTDGTAIKTNKRQTSLTVHGVNSANQPSFVSFVFFSNYTLVPEVFYFLVLNQISAAK